MLESLTWSQLLTSLLVCVLSIGYALFKGKGAATPLASDEQKLTAKEEKKGGCCDETGDNEQRGCCGGGECTEQVSAAITAGKRVRIIFATQKGTARNFAHKLFSTFLACRFDEDVVAIPRVDDAATVDVDTLHTSADLIVLILSSYAGGTAPDSCKPFATLLEDMSRDFRFQRDHFSSPQFAVFGLGDLVYGEDFNGFAKHASDWIVSLGGKLVVPPVYASEQRAAALFIIFSKSVIKFVEKKWVAKAGLNKRNGGAASSCGSIATTAGGAPEESDSDHGGDDAGDQGDAAVDDVEELIAETAAANELLYPRLRQNLTKQGYALIGTHSGVKLCRWTKSMLRGRGGCYKHTFYNISSFQCMEMTPSLACANKCVFCWRHHTNPVTRAFTWKHDSPEFLVENGLAAHRNMMKQMKGVPGVLEDRLTEAMSVKHCALSLVGEPIIYPEISRFVNILHEKHISSFMVTNAQFPDQIRDLAPVTQLYVSIDAGSKEALQKIDRPIFEDFWERYLACIKEISLKQQRTVFRLTLVNGYNVSDLDGYAKLVRMGNPDFIEVKGVTYCGASSASDLTMKNVPFHVEVVKFCQDLIDAIGGDDDNADDGASEAAGNALFAGRAYAIACEHEHSCCMLLAKRKFHIKGTWHTWIDYAKFFQLVESGRTDFTALDYAAATPAWATFNSQEHGFDPAEIRHRRKKPITSGC